jgi:hypothetical protein
MKPNPAFALMLGALLTLSTGCAESPSSIETPDAPAPPPFPQAAATAVIYIRTDTLDARGPASRYVLNADSSFALQFTSVRHGFHEYAGRYARVDTAVALDFRDPTVLGRWEWQASAILRGDSLGVRYNIAMALDDFVDGVYVKSR